MVSRVLPSGGATWLWSSFAVPSRAFIRCGNDHQRDFCRPGAGTAVVVVGGGGGVVGGNSASVAESDSSVFARWSSGVLSCEQWLEFLSIEDGEEAQPDDVEDGRSLETRRPTSWWSKLVSPFCAADSCSLLTYYTDSQTRWYRNLGTIATLSHCHMQHIH